MNLTLSLVNSIAVLVQSGMTLYVNCGNLLPSLKDTLFARELKLFGSDSVYLNQNLSNEAIFLRVAVVSLCSEFTVS